MSFFSVRVFPPIKACAFSAKVHPVPYHSSSTIPPSHYLAHASAPITTSYLVDMFKHTKPSMQGAQRQRGPSPSYPERQSLPPTCDSVPNNYVPSVRKMSAAAPSAQSQPLLYHPSQYDPPSQTNYALARTGASVPAAMSPFAAAKNFCELGRYTPFYCEAITDKIFVPVPVNAVLGVLRLFPPPPGFRNVIFSSLMSLSF